MQQLTPDPVRLVPKTLSYSSYSLYERCPSAYEYRYILGHRDQQESEALRVGNEVHDLLEQYYRNRDLPFPEHAAIHKDWVETLMALRTDTCQAESWLDAEVPGIPVRIVAKVDYMNGPFVVDFKTGKRIKSDVSAVAQLHLYAALLFHNNPNFDHIEAQLDYLRHPPSKKNPVKRVYKRGPRPMIDVWFNRARRLYEAKKFPKQQSWLCRYCDNKECSYNAA